MGKSYEWFIEYVCYLTNYGSYKNTISYNTPQSVLGIQRTIDVFGEDK